MEKVVEVMTSESPSEEDFSWMTTAVQSLVDSEDTASSSPQKSSIQVVANLLKELSLNNGGGKLDSEFAGQFLITFRYFLPPNTFFKKLILRYAAAVASPNDCDKKQIQQRIYLIIKEWVQKHFYDFEADPEMFKTLQNFAHNTLVDSQSQTLIKLIEKQVSATAELKKVLLPDPNGARNMTVDILTLKPDEVARQITLLSFNKFKQVKPVELYFQAWSKENKKSAAPNASAMIELFNRLSSWAASEVVAATTIKRRVQVLKFFISVGWAAYGYRDYETTFMICIGLSQFAVSRLSETWRSLDPKTRQQWHKISTFTSYENNYKTYRAYMKGLFKSSKGHNVFPYFGLYLRDLTAVEEGSGNYDSLGSVNSHKMKMVSTIISEIQKSQKSMFSFAPDLNIMSYLTYGVTNFDEDALYALSKRCEASSGPEGGNEEHEEFKPEHEPEMVVRNPVFGLQMPKRQRVIAV